MRSKLLASAVSTALIAMGSADAIAQSAEPGADAKPADTTTQSGAAQLEEVVVTGFRSSLEKGIELKREAVGVRDSIVAEDIGKFPEQNVAESLQRIPGVFLTRDGASNEGQRVSIRGLGPQYSLTTINGAPAHTTSSQNVGSSTRDFNFDVFPSELFGRVDVYKSPLAHLAEGGIAGVVDLQTPRPFDVNGQQIRYAASTNYNDQSEDWGPRGSFLVSDTWGNFGALLGVAYANNVNERSGFQSTGGYNSSALGSRPYYPPAPAPNTTGPFQFELDLNNPRANFGQYTREQVANAYMPRFYRVFTSSNERERIGTVASLQFQTDRLEVSLDGIYSQLEDAPDEFTMGVAVRNSRTAPGSTAAPGTGNNSGLIPLDVRIDQYNNLYGTFGNTSFIGESFYRNSKTKFTYGILRGVYTVNDRMSLSASVNASESNAWYSENRIVANLFGVDSRFDPSSNVSYPTISTPVDLTDPDVFTAPTLGFALNREIDRENTGQIQFDWDMGEFAGIHWSSLVGANRISTTKRIQRQDGSSIARSRELPGGGTFNTIDVYSYMNPYIQYGRLENGGNPGYLSQFATFPRSFIMDFLGANSANRAAPVALNAAFEAQEVVTAGYIEINGDTSIAGHGLRGNIGVRYADTETNIDNYKAVGGGQFAPQELEGGYDNVLPSMSLAFDITPDLILRASAGKTLTRAALTQIASGTNVPNIFNGDITVGNSNLKPQISTSIDGSLEWYFSEGGLLSFATFDKTLKDNAVAVTDLVTLGSTGLPDSAFNAVSLGFPDGNIPDDFLLRRTTFTNQGEIKLNGMEFAYQQTFNFLPAPFDGLGAMASYTMIETDGNTFITTAGRRIEVPLVPEDSYSVTGYYEKGPVGVRATYTYRTEAGTSNANTGANINNGNDQIPYLSPLGYLDASVSYKLTDAIELRLDALNLTNENTYIYYKDPEGPSGNGESRRDNSFYNGRTLSFGVRGQF
ncbi:TonB-dependent receptor [Steroidobacter agaridevorans]|uniref:TonB-dependent receptor n=1 Tax=Steroidobacter agaridevorans TaxID=2695856 RepID=UPI00137B330B|nr:TonB-dependent receptor [Steroidobacter agaridevorans]